jgi:hypothetical protein
MRRRMMEMTELEIPMTTDRHWELKQRTHMMVLDPGAAAAIVSLIHPLFFTRSSSN